MRCAANAPGISPRDPEWWVRHALASRRPDSKRWRTCVTHLALHRSTRSTLARAVRLCAAKSKMARIFGVDLLVAVATMRTPLWLDAAHVVARMREDVDMDVRMRAAGGLVDVTHRRTSRRTALRLAVHADPLARLSATAALAFEGGSAPRAALLRLARDESSEVREGALTALNWGESDVPDGEELEDTLAACVDDVDEMVSMEAQTGLALRGFDVDPPLPLLFRRGYLDPRALRAAAARRDPSYRAILETLRERFADGAPRRIRELLDAAILASTLPS